MFIREKTLAEELLLKFNRLTEVVSLKDEQLFNDQS